MPEPVPEIKEALKNSNIAELTIRLTGYAVYKIGQLTWEGRRGCGLLPGGISPEDLVQQAFTKALEGQRVWDPVRCPSIYKFLAGIIRSDISTIVEGQEHRGFSRESSLSDGDGNAVSLDQLNIQDPSHLEKENEEIHTDFYLNLCDDPELAKLLEHMFDGHITPRDLAVIMDRPVEEINNLKRRFRRRWQQFQAKKMEMERKLKKEGNYDRTS